MRTREYFTEKEQCVQRPESSFILGYIKLVSFSEEHAM